MAKELAYVLINPYTIAKSRTGGVIARYVGRTDLDLVAARMFGPTPDLVRRYSDLVRAAAPEEKTCQLIADYIREAYAPNPATGRPRRVMMLLFEGEDAVRKIWEATGGATSNSPSGQTIRDTYGDFILDRQGSVQYFEPAVLVAPNLKRARSTARLWASFSRECGGVIYTADKLSENEEEMTLVMLKPDNFRYPSLRAGNIIDILSRSGLRIVAAKKFAMTVSQAEDFYGPVREALARKFEEIGSGRAAKALSQEFGLDVKEEDVRDLCRHLGPAFAHAQFESIVEFMTGYKPSQLPHVQESKGFLDRVRGLWSRMTGQELQFVFSSGSKGCLALVYRGPDAIKTIRRILGPTDPRKAEPGSVRREFGSDIMVNAAHASDSPESAQREMGIIDLEEDTITPWVERYYGKVSRSAMGRGVADG